MSAWHGDPALKARIVERMKAHRAADNLIQAVYQTIDPETALGYRGCAVGCALDRVSSDGAEILNQSELVDGTIVLGWHAEMGRQLGFPPELARLIDNIFEEQDYDAADFAVKILEVAPVGADLSGVHSAFCDLEDSKEGATTRAERLCRLVAESPTDRSGGTS